MFCDFDNIYGYVLVVLKDNLFDTNKKNEYGGVPIDLLVEDEVIIIKKSKYTGKRLNKVKKSDSNGSVKDSFSFILKWMQRLK